MNDFFVLDNTLGNSYLLPSRMLCLWVLIGGNKWCNLWLSSWISVNSFLHISRHRPASDGSSATWSASSYVASGIIIFNALSWMFSTELLCYLEIPPCHTKEQYMLRSLSIEMFASSRILRKYSLWEALAVIELMCASHDRLSLFVTPSSLVWDTFSIFSPPISRVGMCSDDHAKLMTISFVFCPFIFILFLSHHSIISSADSWSLFELTSPLPNLEECGVVNVLI